MKPHALLEPYAQKHNGLFYFDSKHGAQTLLLVHGNGDEADTWRHIFAPLAQHYRVIAPDLPGFGRSHTQTSSLAGFVTALLELLDALKLERVHLCGSSLGAVVAAMLAAQAPSRAISLCCIGGASPSLGGLSVTPAVQPLLELGLGEGYYNGLRDAGQDAAFATLKPYYANLEALPASDLVFLRTRVWQRVQSDTQRDAFFAALRSLFMPAVPLELHLPTKLIWGEFDNIISRVHALQIFEQVPHASLQIIANAGHLPHQEQPAATLEAIRSLVWI